MCVGWGGGIKVKSGHFRRPFLWQFKICVLDEY
nr:MAG TPA: hypothetical protein [Caudoviricetes sp.]